MRSPRLRDALVSKIGFEGWVGGEIPYQGDRRRSDTAVFLIIAHWEMLSDNGIAALVSMSRGSEDLRAFHLRCFMKAEQTSE